MTRPEQESRFLYLVATHSGYFTAHQFLDYTGTSKGWKVHQFTSKSIRLVPRSGRHLRTPDIQTKWPCVVASVLDTVEKQSDLGKLAGFGACTLGYHVALESGAFLQGNVVVLPLDLGIDGIADLCATSIDFAD